MKCCRLVLAAMAGMLIVAGLVGAYSNGTSFEAVTGAPGESTCADCHNNLNTGSGSATITAPAGYQPGDTMDITVSVQHSGQSIWGFELTVLDATASPVGEILVTDAVRTQHATAVSGREYIKHTLDGSDASKANNTDWSFQWVAPPTDVGLVTFYMAAVAGDEAAGPNGDYTYTDTHSMLATAVVDVTGSSLPGKLALSQNYPNPFNPATTVEFDLPVRSRVALTVFNVLGQQVKVLHEGILPAGSYRTRWDGTDARGSQVVSGVYFYRLQTEESCAVRKMVLLK
ncbi:MAG: T9SS type A sorting domain-containing protein [Candidatus Zixiibacteriota bacterium]|nr:MAG: T9SS type A sorting domain-containing protein [candidate division Zixibacteria bacterium]